MRHTTGVAIDCESCGFTTGHYNADGDVRCDECGRFASTTDKYCAKHDTRIENLPTGYSRCPMCEEEERIERERAEIAARRANPRMHPTVDAKRF